MAGIQIMCAFSMPKKLKERLKKVAYADGETMLQVVSRLIEKYLKKKEK